jgi:hypothetical protein
MDNPVAQGHMDGMDLAHQEHETFGSPSLMFEGLGMDGIDQTQPEYEPLDLTSLMFEGLGLDEADEEEGDDGEKVAEQEQFCIVCALPTTKPLMLLTYLKEEGRLEDPYCLDCADTTARGRLTRNGDQLVNLTPAEQRVLVITHLLDHIKDTCTKPHSRRVREVVLLAGYYNFCQGCLDFNAHVEMPGQPCNTCQSLRRCCGCSRSSRLVVLRIPCNSRPNCDDHDGADFLCAYCCMQGCTRQMPD